MGVYMDGATEGGSFLFSFLFDRGARAAGWPVYCFVFTCLGTPVVENLDEGGRSQSRAFGANLS